MRKTLRLLAAVLLGTASLLAQSSGGNHGSGSGSGTGTPGSTLFSSTTQAGPNNSAVETSVIGTVTGSTTIPANTFLNGMVLQVTAEGFYSLPATATSLQVTLYCGATNLGRASFTPPAGAITNGTWTLNAAITAIGSGASGALITNGSIDLHSTGPSLIASGKFLNTANVAFDFTTACVFDLKALWGTAQVGQSITGTNVTAYVPGAPVSSVFALTGAVPNLSGAITTNSSTVTSPGKDDLLDSQNFCAAASASGTAYTCSLTPAISAYVTGTHYRFKADVANTGACSINLNALGAKTIKKAAGGITTDLVANDLQAGQWVDLVYDGTNMQMQSTLGNAAGTSVSVNGSNVSNPNFNGTTPAAPANSANLTFQVSGSSISGYFGAAGSGLGLTKNGACGAGTFANGLYNADGTVQCSAAAGAGTVNSGTANQIAYYAGTGTAVSGNPRLTENGTSLNYSGTAGITTAGPINTNSGSNLCGTSSPCWGGVEGATGPTPALNDDFLFMSSAIHWLEISANNAALEPLAGLNGTMTAGHAVSVKNGNEIQDAGYSATAIPNADLQNSSTTPNGTTCTLGSTCNVGQLNDTNGNATVKSAATASAVDQVTVTNAAAGNPATVTISATGTDTNINLNLVSKGTGTVQCNGSSCGGGGGTPATQLGARTYTSVIASGTNPPTALGTALVLTGTFSSSGCTACATLTTFGETDTGVANNVAGFGEANPSVSPNKNPYFEAVSGTSSVTGVRWFVGLSQNTGVATQLASTSPSFAWIGFQFDTSASDTHIMCVGSDGTTVNRVDSGITPTAGGINAFEIIYSGGGTTVQFQINGSQVCGSSVTHFPTGTTQIGRVGGHSDLGAVALTSYNNVVYLSRLP